MNKLLQLSAVAVFALTSSAAFANHHTKKEAASEGAMQTMEAEKAAPAAVEHKAEAHKGHHKKHEKKAQ